MSSPHARTVYSLPLHFTAKVISSSPAAATEGDEDEDADADADDVAIEADGDTDDVAEGDGDADDAVASSAEGDEDGDGDDAAASAILSANTSPLLGLIDEMNTGRGNGNVQSNPRGIITSNRVGASEPVEERIVSSSIIRLAPLVS